MARYLVQSKIDVELRKDHVDPNNPRPARLPPGMMRLYSYYKPSLQAATYGIQAKQTITAIKGDDKNPTSSVKFNTKGNNKPLLQEFEVIAPQFSLDPKLINSYYPPSGHSDEGKILPHIVFQDPHVPWYRPAGLSLWMTDAVDTTSPLDPDPKPNADGHNLMPWMGLLVFKPADLIVDGTAANTLGITANGLQAYDPTKLPANGAYQMTVGQYLTNITSRVCYEAGHQISNPSSDPTKSLEQTSDDAFKDLKNSSEVTQIIFPTKSQVKIVLGGGDSMDLGPLKAQRFLSHVRHLNTIGFPDAGVEDEGLFSVVVSLMSGDQNIAKPQTHIVHLVSLEHIDATLQNPKSLFKTSTSDRIGLVSLYSWTYTCIPNSVSFKETMIELANSAQPLRPPNDILNGLQKATTDKVKQALFFRLNAGYTICRWRTATGEETVAYNRGPLVPLPAQDVPTSAIPPTNKAKLWPALSMTGKDYQVYDQGTGIMDTTYSGAWSCGRLMAISDSIFNAALMRLRSNIWKQASSAVRMATAGTPTTATQLANAAAAVKGVATLTDGRNFMGNVTRLNKPAAMAVPPAVTDGSVVDAFREAVDLATNNIASSTSKDSGKALIYNGFDKTPSNNSDWEVVLNWVHDVMFLATIPAHMIFPEPSHLQSLNLPKTPNGQKITHPEALRFFHIDHAWIDCFLDGALSVANHLEPDFDYTRLRIKAIINKFLDTPIGDSSIRPPVPRYGFVIRSAVVKSTPDLKLTATAWTIKTGPDGKRITGPDGKIITGERDCLLRHTRMDENTILSLIDCLPEEIKEIRLAQPAHQQRFQIECNFEADAEDPRVQKVIPDISIKRLFTDRNQAPSRLPTDPTSKSLEWERFSDLDFGKFGLGPLVQEEFYDSETRCIRPTKIAEEVNKIVQKWAGDSSFKTRPYDDPVPNSCILGIELNDSAYELKLDGPFTEEDLPTPPVTGWVRKLWLGEFVPAPVKPRLSQPTGDDITKAPKPDSSSNVKPPGDIQVNSPNPSLTVGDIPTVFANNTTVIPRKPLTVKFDVRNPFADSADPQFILVVHPAYKPPPPIRFRRKDDQYGAEIYSPLDYLPTDTITLYDVIFAVRRRGILDTKKTLKSITIEIPTLDKSKLPGPDYNKAIEPLLDSEDWSSVGVSMCSNQRFVPTLYSGTATYVNQPMWDSRQVLGITLIPRASAKTSSSGAMPLLKDNKAAEASVRLSQPRVLPMMNKKSQVSIAGSTPMTKARSLIRMIERYGTDTTDEYQYSWCTVLKQATGDKDLAGNDV